MISEDGPPSDSQGQVPQEGVPSGQLKRSTHRSLTEVTILLRPSSKFCPPYSLPPRCSFPEAAVNPGALSENRICKSLRAPPTMPSTSRLWTDEEPA